MFKENYWILMSLILVERSKIKRKLLNMIFFQDMYNNINFENCRILTPLSLQTLIVTYQAASLRL